MKKEVRLSREVVEQGMTKPAKEMRVNILRRKDVREKLLPRKELGKNMLSKNGLAEKIFAHGGDGKHDLEQLEEKTSLRLKMGKKT